MYESMTWNDYIYFAVPAILCWLLAAGLVFKLKKPLIPDVLMLIGILLFTIFIIGLWQGLERPPMRTLGETRLWYSFFLVLIGFITYKRWKYKWLLCFSALMACLFACINIFKPEIHNTSLMPALQSYWFVPHVIVYMLSYAVLGAATIAAILQLIKIAKGKKDENLFKLIDNITYVGFAFLLLGLILGAIWAKEAWGHYWSWDPKETWAFITAAAYLVYIHMRLQKNHHVKTALWILIIAFLLLMVTWFGVNYLPTAQDSVHTYTS